jgi:hypothetical protein
MERWFSQFLSWLQVSPHGRAESNAENNHGSYYDAQVADFALFLGKRDQAAQVLKDAGQKRIARQIAVDGSQPFELARTRSLSYSTFNLQALVNLATLSAPLGIDLWHYHSSNGGSIRRALDFLLPYTLGEKKWPYRQIEDSPPEAFIGVLLSAAAVYRDAGYEAAAEKLGGAGDHFDLLLLQAVLAPISRTRPLQRAFKER